MLYFANLYSISPNEQRDQRLHYNEARTSFCVRACLLPMRQTQRVFPRSVFERPPFPTFNYSETLLTSYVRRATHHLTRPPPPRFGFCFSRGFASCAAIVGAEGPMSEYSSREMPSGFRARSVAAGCLRSCDGPLGEGSERILRTSAADGPAIIVHV